VTDSERRQASAVQAKVKKKARDEKTASAPRLHIKDVSDEALLAMTLRDVSRLQGVTVMKSTISTRMKNEAMGLREAAQTPPRTPRRYKPGAAWKRRFYGRQG
jgi:hypothetical protein